MPNIEMIELAALSAYERNARTHPEDQIDQIVASIKEFGFTNPVLIDNENGIIAGHGRVMAAKVLALKEVPCLRLGHLNETQKKAYILADNKIAMNSGWDFELLRLELQDLDTGDFDLTLTGFNEKELEDLMTWAPKPELAEGLTDPDAVPELQEETISQPGDVWLLGKHRLACGDSTDALVVEKALKGVVPHLMVTDPPYGVKYDASRRAKGLKDGADRALGKVLNDDRADWQDAWVLFPGNVCYVWHAMKTAHIVHRSLIDAGFDARSQIVWRKTRHTLSPANINEKTMGYNPQHECAFYAVKKGSNTHWEGGRSQTTVWEIDHSKSETGHSTQKPVECMRRPIENNSSPGQAIYEPFSGSGTTIIAGEQTGRAVHAIELSPQYVDVAIRRWQDFTGKQAYLEETGQPFQDVVDFNK